MKKLIISTLAVLALTTTAFATDLPKKNKAPVPPVAPVAAEAPAASTDSLSISYAQDGAQNFGAKIDDSYSITYSHSLGGGISAGFKVNSTQTTSNALSGYGEAQVGYKLPTFAGVTLSAKLGVGERLKTTGNYPYYDIYGNADYKVMDKVTWNAIQYRWRSPFDTVAYDWQSHQIGTGVTYDIASNISLNANVYRQWNQDFSTVTNDGVGFGVTLKF